MTKWQNEKISTEPWAMVDQQIFSFSKKEKKMI